jgi:hypothetical protein
MPVQMPVIDRDLNEKPFRQLLVKVTNTNDFPINDMYDGVQYLFEPGKESKLPADAANHILGWTENASRRDMFLHIQKRWGWNTPQWADKSQRFFDKFKITHAAFRLVEVAEGEEPTADHETKLTLETEARGARRA